MAYGGPQTPRKKNHLDEYKLRLSAPAVQGAKRKPSLAVSVAKNNPRITVYTNVEGAKDNGRISANMDTQTMFAMFSALQEVIDGPADSKITITNMNHTFYQGKRSPEPQVVSKTILGKEPDGTIYISVIAKDQAMVKFPFLPSEYHSFVHKDGSPWQPPELSKLYAKGWVDIFSSLIPFVLVNEYEEPPPRDPPANGGGGGNSYGNRGGQGGGQQQRGNSSANRGGDSWDSGGDNFGGDDLVM
jgi:hypothetical protein